MGPTQTTILTSMLFRSDPENTKESDESLEKMLFKDEEVTTKSTPRLPKVSQENFATTTDISIEVTLPSVSQMKNVTTEAKNMMQDQPQMDHIDPEYNHEHNHEHDHQNDHQHDPDHLEYVQNGIEE